MRRTSRPRRTGILLIAIYRLAKGLLLVAAAVGLLKLLHHDVARTVTHWVEVLKVDPDNRYIHRLLVKLLSVNDRKLKEISAGTFFYAALSLIEGTGLALGKRWAEYLTIIATASFIPLEVYELIRRFTPPRLLVLAANLAVIVYLAVGLVGYRRRP